MKLSGLPPVVPSCPRMLILGSMPGAESLRQQQYYAHPRNAFWPIMGAFIGFDADIDYARRIAFLRQHQIALWDVLKHCERKGSLDSAIKTASEEANDLAGFLRDYSHIKVVLFNGKKAESSFNRHVLPTLPSALVTGVCCLALPSSSPANTRYSVAEKYAKWHPALAGGIAD